MSATSSPEKKSILIVCGGPSAERGISLNSARSLYDNLDRSRYALSLIYFDTKLTPYAISEKQIYSNTPFDFDYLLNRPSGARPNINKTRPQGATLFKRLSKNELFKRFRAANVVFPAIHGAFGEDGKLQSMLEKANARYVGSGSSACRITNDKHLCMQFIRKHGFFTLPTIAITRGERLPVLPRGEWIVKPQNGGSSIGVFRVSNQAELEEKIKKVFQIDDHAVIEPLCTGKEFTIIVLENAQGEPVSLLPTEIEFNGDALFDYRKKYLATGETRYHTPARFPDATIVKIRREAARLFKLLKMRDFARLDGWLMKDGKLWFSDINAISGMEQNSFLFQQPALLGLSHRQTLEYIISKKISGDPRKIKRDSVRSVEREVIPVIFGGANAERNVSIMSGTNVWIKLKSSARYRPIPYFFDGDDRFFSLPHFLCLHHTAEEIKEKTQMLQNKSAFAALEKLRMPILKELGIDANEVDEPLFVPQAYTLGQLARRYRFMFLGLHGSPGEDGILQRKLDKFGVKYNGSGEHASKLCMDKFEAARSIDHAQIPGVRTAKKISISVKANPAHVWRMLQQKKFSANLIVKPRADGSSTGVMRIQTLDHLTQYLKFMRGSFSFIPAGAIHHAHGIVYLPQVKNKILIEEFIETDRVKLHHQKIDWQDRGGWIEVTCGEFGKRGALRVMQPSQTIAAEGILSLEEKFMGGTGVNFTPPPRRFVSPAAVARARMRIKKVAEKLGIEGYSRIDFFMHRKTGKVIIIEVNTLPALTPSTVLFHQALAEHPPITPEQFLEELIELGKAKTG